MDKEGANTKSSFRDTLAYRMIRYGPQLFWGMSVPLMAVTIMLLMGLAIWLIPPIIESPDEARSAKYEPYSGANRPSLFFYGPFVSWNHDGSKIAFQYNNSIYTINSDGRGLKRISANKENKRSDYAINPQFSPDGKSVAYSWYKKDSIFPWSVDRNWQIIVQPLRRRETPGDYQIR